MKINLAAITVTFIINEYGLCSEETFNGMKFCTDSGSCHVSCNNLTLNLKRDKIHLREVIGINKLENKKCALKLNQCAYTYTKRKTHVWNIFRHVKLETLKIVNSQVELNELGLENLKNLKRLLIKNTKTVSLRTKLFQESPNLRKLRINKNKLLKWAEKGLLTTMKLEYLQIQEMKLNESETRMFFQNLSSDCDVPSIRTLDWSNNNFGFFSKNYLKHFPNLRVLILSNSNIVHLEKNAFRHNKLRRIFLEGNKIQRLSENIFPVNQRFSGINIKNNELICDCEMEWLQNFVKKNKNVKLRGDFQNVTCASPKGSTFLEAKMCGKAKPGIMTRSKLRDFCVEDKKASGNKKLAWTSRFMISRNFQKNSSRIFIKNDEPEFIEIELSDSVSVDEAYLLVDNFANSSSPEHRCFKIQRRSFLLIVAPGTNYLICLMSKKNFRVRILQCQLHKTKHLYEDQVWLTKKSITLSAILIFFSILFAMVLGALILYLSVHNNPSLIRGSKRVIEVKRHDKAQILIMPRGYENWSGTEDLGGSGALVPADTSASSVSCDTMSTVSYISANQPTQLEILTYRLNRLREIFQNRNDIPPPTPSLPIQVAQQARQRIPPHVDLLFEYEWYTITTTTTEV